MKKLITSALPYVNNVPHLGNIIGSVLSADVYARFCRLRGYETRYICGTDEYGTATENKAREEGLTPRQICDKYHAIHAEIYRTFNISFDAFGRTSTETQTEVAQGIFKDLDANGFIQEATEERIYCQKDEMFLADRYVEGTCPKCGYEDARGDQCDNCGSLLDPESLIDPRCKVCGTPPSKQATTHLFLELDRLQADLTSWFDRAKVEGHWPNNALTTTRGWLERGLQPRAITRDLKWGIPVPKPGFEDKVFYVWFDAPIGYISITAKAFEDWRDWWQNPDQVKLYQFMAKDNIPFHTVIFPASLIGTRKNWTLLHHINSTEYLNYEDAKFSKSRNVGVFGDDVKKTDIAIDLWRFYLLLNRPERNDTVFSWTEFFERVNAEFIDNIGNLVNRTLVYLQKNFDGKIADLAYDELAQTFMAESKAECEQLTQALEAVKLREALRLIVSLGNRGNKFFQEAAPWERIKTDRDSAHSVVSVLTYLVRTIAVALEPYMPETSQRLLGYLNLEQQSWEDIGKFDGLDGHVIGQAEILHRKLDMKDAEKWRKKFSGNAPNFGRFQIKVGEIEAVEAHESAEHLYVLRVNIGEDRVRTIVAGLVKHYSAEELQGRRVMVLANLKPAELRGVASEGMILTAEHRKKMALLDASAFAVGAVASLGDGRVKWEELDISAFKEAPFKLEDGNASFDGQPILVEGYPIPAPGLTSGKIR